MYLRTCLGIYTDKKHYRMTMLRRAFWVGIETGRYQSGFSIETHFSPLPVLSTNNIEEQRTTFMFYSLFSRPILHHPFSRGEKYFLLA